VTYVNGTSYYTFAISVSEYSYNSQVSLDQFQLWTSNISNLTIGLENFGMVGTKRFDMDIGVAGGDTTLIMNDTKLSQYSPEVAVFIPTSILAGASSSDYLYMYQTWGCTVAHEAYPNSYNNGAEITYIGRNLTPVPEVSSVAPLAGVLGGLMSLGFFRRRRKA
jgi:hypothetical protein